jgi:hypothetical protein
MQSGGGDGGGAGGGIWAGNNGLFNETGTDSRVVFFIFFKCGYFYIF